MTTSSRRRIRWELAAVSATTALHLVTWTWPVLHAVIVVAAVIGWAVYVVVRARRDGDIPRQLGLTRAGLGRTWRLTLPLAALATAIFAGIGHLQGTFALPWTLVVLLAIYPIWGLIQQLLVQGLVVRNLDRMPFFGKHPWAAALAGGLMFGLAHWPFWELMLATTLMGTIFAVVWQRYRNLWPLGLWHGWLGALFFLWVMGRDPLAETLAGLPI